MDRTSTSRGWSLYEPDDDYVVEYAESSEPLIVQGDETGDTVPEQQRSETPVSGLSEEIELPCKTLDKFRVFSKDYWVELGQEDFQSIYNQARIRNLTCANITEAALRTNITIDISPPEVSFRAPLDEKSNWNTNSPFTLQSTRNICRSQLCTDRSSIGELIDENILEKVDSLKITIKPTDLKWLQKCSRGTYAKGNLLMSLDADDPTRYLSKGLEERNATVELNCEFKFNIPRTHPIERHRAKSALEKAFPIESTKTVETNANFQFFLKPLMK